MSALVKFEGGGQIAERPSFDLREIQEIGQIFVKSGFFKDTKDASQAIVKVMAGAELGFGPMASMGGIYIVKGKVSLSANLLAAAIKRSGKYNYKLRTLNTEVCRIEFFEGKESLGISEFTMKEAKEGKLHQDYDSDKREWKDKQTWKNFPRNMLFSRAMSNGVKWYCPDLTAGPCYTPDELGVEEDENGNPVEIRKTEPEAINIKPAGRQSATIEPDGAPLSGLSAALLAWAIKEKRNEKAGKAYYDAVLAKMSAKDMEMFASEKGIRWDEGAGDAEAQAAIHLASDDKEEQARLALAESCDLKINALEKEHGWDIKEIEELVNTETGGEAVIDAPMGVLRDLEKTLDQMIEKSKGARK